MGVGGQHHAPAALPAGKNRYPLYRRLGWPQDRSRQVKKISSPTGFRLQDRPARSESLYWLSYRGPKKCKDKAKYKEVICKLTLVPCRFHRAYDVVSCKVLFNIHCTPVLPHYVFVIGIETCSDLLTTEIICLAINKSCMH